MPGRDQEPSIQLASGTTDERDGSYNLTTLGSIFYNTDTSNVEVRHVDPSNNVGWRDLVMNNKEQIDISGNLHVTGSITSGTFQAWGISGHSSPAVNMSVGAGNYFPYYSSYAYEHYNYGGLWSGLQVTIDQDGLYYISWEALCPSIYGNQNSRPSIYVNNSGTTYMTQHRGVNRYDAGNSVSAIMELDDGDTISIRTAGSVGDSNRLQWYNNKNYNIFCGYLIQAL